jgi:hypothetical protein
LPFGKMAITAGCEHVVTGTRAATLRICTGQSTTGIVVASIGNLRGVFSAHGRADSQLRNHSKNVDRSMRTTGAVTHVLRDGFFAPVDDGSKYDRGHVLFVHLLSPKSLD